MKLGVSAFIPVALYVLYEVFVGDIPATSPLLRLLTFPLVLVYGSFLGWGLIMAAKAVKHDIPPPIRKMVRQSDEVWRAVVEKFIRNPGQTVRESWNEL